MTEIRWHILRAMLAVDGDGSTPLDRVCAVTVSCLGVTGAGVTLVNPGDAQGPQVRLGRASDERTARLEELELTVGEGPGLRTATTGVPVLVPDLSVAGDRWPAYLPLARETGVAAVFAFPMALGSIRLGSLSCYRETTGSLTEDQLRDGLILAELAFEAVLAEVAGRQPDDLGWIHNIHVEVHQASGIVMYHLGITMQAALLRIRGYAFASGTPLAEVARRIVNRDLVLESEE